MAKAKPFIKWVGGKSQLIEQLDAQLPADFGNWENVTYIEPACRYAIDKTIISPIRKEYEKRISSGEVIISAISSNQITDIRNLHIDHYDKTFNELVVEFINQEGREYLFSMINMGKQNSPYTRFVDSIIDVRFISFHNANTHLRAITKEENLSL